MGRNAGVGVDKDTGVSGVVKSWVGEVKPKVVNVQAMEVEGSPALIVREIRKRVVIRGLEPLPTRLDERNKLCDTFP